MSESDSWHKQAQLSWTEVALEVWLKYEQIRAFQKYCKAKVRKKQGTHAKACNKDKSLCETGFRYMPPPSENKSFEVKLKQDQWSIAGL